MTDTGLAVVITGGSRGLGLGLVTDLLAQGYRVATCSRARTPAMADLETQNVRSPGRFLWMAAELGKESEEVAFFERVGEWLGQGGLYGLINNAAITGEGILSTFPNVDIERIVAVNLTSAIRISRLALRRILAANQTGRIINISSIVGLRGYTGLAAYSASKAGLDGLTRSLAREVGRRRITVNSIAPGYLTTDLSASLRPEQRQQIINRTPLGRLGTVVDIVPLARFLLSSDAAFITGQTLVVDGGISC